MREYPYIHNDVQLYVQTYVGSSLTIWPTIGPAQLTTVCIFMRHIGHIGYKLYYHRRPERPIKKT